MFRIPRSIDEMLGDEVKRELADRYFGFRKIIEEDQLDFRKKLRLHSFILEKRISFDLIRIYILLKDETLISDFLQLAGIEEKLFYDPYLTESPTIRARVYEGQKSSGFTRYGRFKHLMLNFYSRLELHVIIYHKKLVELEHDIETINEEIRMFYRKNDLVAIMGFLRSLGDHDKVGIMAGSVESGIAEDLDQKMEIKKMENVDQYLPVLELIAPLGNIKTKLKKLIKKAYKLHSLEEQLYFSQKDFQPAARK